MTFYKRLIKIVALMVILALAYTGFAFGAVSSEEAAKLGTTLTGVGAEKAGNKDGTIPPYTGGLTTPPANFVPGSGIYPDPFASETPLFSINAQNMAQYADKLTDGTKALMKSLPTFRIDVYKTHRTVAFPDFVIRNTAKNAVKAYTTNGGLTLNDAHAGIPFPIPKNGFEAMWNHLVSYNGQSRERRFSNVIVDSNGRLIESVQLIVHEEFPYYFEDTTRADQRFYMKARVLCVAPPRKAGEAYLVMDAVDMYNTGRIAYLYLPGQRRVKLAPEVGYDSPNSWAAGTSTYDESLGFIGPLDRFDWKIVGKKEIYIPYNAYKTVYKIKKEELLGPKHMNTDKVRWELHRTWVVEATLKPGKRHIYHKRMFYLDEDSWAVNASEHYDARGNLFKANFNFQIPRYDIPASDQYFVAMYNLISRNYCLNNWGGENGYFKAAEVLPLRDWAPAALATLGTR
ncbi:MAG: DUF1329 domain-containing protein [Dehalococcoidia bacterium]